VFGTLKPHTCRGGCAARHEYETFYCGLCKSLGDNYGTPARALLSYDAVFLALVADGLVEEAAAPDRCRCPLLPVTFRPTVRPDSPAMRYAAAMQMLLADQWLADRAMDGRRVARAARPLLTGKVEMAREILAGLGISLADLDGFEERQARREVPGVTGPREAAEPTADALARVFERMALLPGAAAEARSDEGRGALAAFGRHLGSAIYLIDALDDLEKDHRGGAFNPCLQRARRGEGMRVAWARVEAAWALLHDDLAALAELVEALPFRRHRDLVRSVAAVELPRLARAAAARAHAYARAEDQRERVTQRGQSWPRRALALAAAAFVLAWVWLSSIPALARGPKRPAPPGTAGVADAGGGGVPPSWEPKLPPAPRPSAQPQAPPAPTGGNKGADPAAPAPAATGTPGGDTGWSPCKGSSSSSGGSSNPCSGCTDCCDVCKKCDCGGCCKVCDSCNSCSSSCGGCCGK
jgi:Family of unknown function (DUF5685)